MKRCLLPFSLAMAVVICGCRGQIPIVGLDDNGKAIETMIPKRKYVTRLTDSVEDISESVVPVMDDAYYGQKQKSLRIITVGLGLKGSVGLGDWFKLGGNIGLRLRFTNLAK